VTPTVDPGEDPPSATSGTDGEVELPTCPAFDDPRTYSPPPDEQPATDPAITSPELFPDIAIGDDEPFEPPEGAGAEHGMEVYGAAREWAEAQAPDHFAGMWIDGEHGAAVIAFTDEVERYATEVRERFGPGWWVVEAERSEAELERLQDAVSDDAVWSGLDESAPGTIVSTARLDDRQMVEIMVVGGDDEVLAELGARFDHPAYCFVVLPPPPTYDDTAEVRTLATAAGWRDGLSQDTGGGVLEIAYDADAGGRAFAENVPDDLPPGDGDDDPSADALHAGLDTVDWDREVVVVWSSGRSGSCPSWVADLHLGDGAIAVETASPVRGACTDDWNPFRTVLAVDRDLLPPIEDLPVPVEEGWSGGGQAVPYPAG
jgi:hypothetical protein